MKNIAQSRAQIDRLIERSRQSVVIGLQTTAAIRLMRQKAEIDTHWPIAWPYWPTGILPKTTALAQKIIRRLLQWYIDPIIKQQNEFNQATVSALQTLVNELRLLQETQKAPQPDEDS